MREWWPRPTQEHFHLGSHTLTFCGAEKVRLKIANMFQDMYEM